MIQTKLKIKTSVDTIDAAHRLPWTKSTDKPAQVIVKFHKRADKQIVMQNRKLLKGSGISISDDLCPGQVELMNRV
jgi:hypothetical protein